MRNITLFLLVLIVFASFSASKNQKQEQNITESKRPNILFLFADDDRDLTIKALGNTEVITPHLDQLVHKRTTFENAFIMGAINGAVCAHLYEIKPEIAQRLLTDLESDIQLGYTRSGVTSENDI